MTDLADVAAALADRTRARMLEELLGGPPLPAGALAVRVGVAPSTVSGHLRSSKRAGLVTIEANGRRREARLAGPHVAEALEALSRIAGDTARPIGLKAVNRKQALREARSCYDHLAGRAGVALADHLLDARRARRARRRLRASRPQAHGYYRERFGVDPDGAHTRRPLVRACTDWTERRPHLAGALGAALLDAMLDRGWLQRRPDGRALNITRDVPRASHYRRRPSPVRPSGSRQRAPAQRAETAAARGRRGSTRLERPARRRAAPARRSRPATCRRASSARARTRHASPGR